MDNEEKQDKLDLEQEIRDLKKTLGRYRYTLLYVSGMVTVAVVIEVLSYL